MSDEDKASRYLSGSAAITGEDLVAACLTWFSIRSLRSVPSPAVTALVSPVSFSPTPVPGAVKRLRMVYSSSYPLSEDTDTALCTSLTCECSRGTDARISATSLSSTYMLPVPCVCASLSLSRTSQEESDRRKIIAVNKHFFIVNHFSSAKFQRIIRVKKMYTDKVKNRRPK